MWIVCAALITAVPASVAAVASLRGNRQLKPNGGSSMRDAINRIETTTNLQSIVLHQHDDRLQRIESVVVQTARANP